MKLEPAAGKILLDLQPPARQYLWIIVEQREIVHVTQVGRLQDFGREMIEAIEIKLRKELTGQVANGQTAAMAERLEQVVAIEVELDRLLRVRAIDNQVQQRQRRRTNDPAAEI